MGVFNAIITIHIDETLVRDIHWQCNHLLDHWCKYSILSDQYIRIRLWLKWTNRHVVIGCKTNCTYPPSGKQYSWTWLYFWERCTCHVNFHDRILLNIQLKSEMHTRTKLFWEWFNCPVLFDHLMLARFHLRSAQYTGTWLFFWLKSYFCHKICDHFIHFIRYLRSEQYTWRRLLLELNTCHVIFDDRMTAEYYIGVLQ